MKVEGKVIVFTGAGSGLGLECVHRKSLPTAWIHVHGYICMCVCVCVCRMG